jgi:hypothetical protein
LPAVAVLVAECGQVLLGALGLDRGGPGSAPEMTGSQDHQARFGEAPGQPVGGLEGGQRVRVPAARQLQHSAVRVDRQSHCGLGFGLRVRSARWIQGSASSGRPCQTSTPATFKLASRRPARRSSRAVRPARRLPARSAARADDRKARSPPIGQPVNSRYGRPIRRASATPWSRCRSGLLEPGHPQLGAAEADQRQRAQLLAQAGPRRLRASAWPAAAAPPRPPPAGPHAGGPAAAGRSPPAAAPAPAGPPARRRPLRQAQVPFGRLQRPAASSSPAATAATSASAASASAGTRQQLVDGRRLPVQVQAGQ